MIFIISFKRSNIEFVFLNKKLNYDRLYFLKFFQYCLTFS